MDRRLDVSRYEGARNVYDFRAGAAGSAGQVLMRRGASAALAAIFILIGAYAFAADLKFPALTGRIVDDADILSASTKSELDAMLAQHERTSSDQVVVVT